MGLRKYRSKESKSQRSLSAAQPAGGANACVHAIAPDGLCAFHAFSLKGLLSRFHLFAFQGYISKDSEREENILSSRTLQHKCIRLVAFCVHDDSCL